MEKRKVYKISIIDKEISRTEFDRNTFYTSDSELSLVFKLIEKDYSYDHGEILLYNENDKSFVTRQITKQDNDFVYELDSDIIPHYGTWNAQLQLVNDGYVYTSKPFEFSIVNDLSNLAPQPTLTDINNWSTLKNNAAELIDEMQDIIVDVEKAELERVSKETYRQQAESGRENNEKERQTGESVREYQENKRQKSELERENNENKRRSSEIGREDKEKTRQTSELERQQAESIRVSAEEQRKTDHANRSAELDGKADKVFLRNIVKNSDFSNGTNYWGSVYSNITTENNVLTMTSEGRNLNPYVFQSTHVDTDDIVYGMAKVKPHEEIKDIYILFDAVIHSRIENPTTDTYHLLSFIHKKAVGNMSYIIRMGLNYLVADVKLDIKEVGIINLTETFGTGNEPTKEEMDELIKITGYINGEYALNNKEMLIWTLGLIRCNKNAIITLGGTI